MNEPKALTGPESTPPENQEQAPETRPDSARPPILPWLYGAGFAVMAAANIALWWNLEQAPPPSAPDLSGMTSQMQSLEGRIAKLEQRPGGPDLTPLTNRVNALEKRTGPDLAPLTARVAALEKSAGSESRIGERVAAVESHLVSSLAELQTRLTNLEQKPAIDPQFAGRVDALAGRVDALSGKVQTLDGEFGRRIEAADTRLARIEGTAKQVAEVAARTARIARLQSAEAALSNGLPLGALAGAPPALARFANTRPPTEASLRLAFPATERAVREASHPGGDDKPLWGRIWDRTQGLVTVRQGDHVVVGDSVSGVLAKAQALLDAGDLTGAVAAMASLQGDPAKAAAPWIASARSLLDARAALADLAAKS